MLKIKVYSFSYLQGQIPADESGNGGGFVFDCRALPNPGRLEAYKTLTGMDESVAAFLTEKKEVKFFLDHVAAICSQSIETYLERGFTNLMIGFGCTGGQHRSVFMAEQMAQYIAQAYEDVVVNLRHLQQEK
ncbi:MAG: ATP-binding protein [Paludibacter sp.]|nr:MAG: ATP-binding protein [Paludibacter sp.]